MLACEVFLSPKVAADQNLSELMFQRLFGTKWQPMHLPKAHDTI
jgi:hypothetical protein